MLVVAFMTYIIACVDSTAFETLQQACLTPSPEVLRKLNGLRSNLVGLGQSLQKGMIFCEFCGCVHWGSNAKVFQGEAVSI